MEHIRLLRQPNLVLEALSYLGAQANQGARRDLKSRLREKGVSDTTEFERRFVPFEALHRHLEAALSLPRPPLLRLFRDLEGFPANSIGAYSPAFLLLFPAACQFDGPPEDFLGQLREMTPQQAARDMLISLNLSDDLDERTDFSALFTDLVLSMNVCDHSRLVLLETQRSYQAVVREAGQLLQCVLEAMAPLEPELLALTQAFFEEVSLCGPERYLDQVSNQRIPAQLCCQLRPLLLGPDMNLALAPAQGEGTYFLYCGALRWFLRQQVAAGSGGRAQVYDQLRLLTDRTRFDLLCYLRSHPAYVQELSDRFSLSRNTIHHHLSKLLSAGIVNCAVSGNRVYYSVNSHQLDALLSHLRALFLDTPPLSHE